MRMFGQIGICLGLLLLAAFEHALENRNAFLGGDWGEWNRHARTESALAPFDFLLGQKANGRTAKVVAHPAV
jgi:hypothetical protein